MICHSGDHTVANLTADTETNQNEAEEECMVYLLLALAVATEVFGDSMMKLSKGFEKKKPIIGIVIGYAISFYLMSRIMLELPLGLTYAMWTGLGIALTALVGIVFWRESCSLKKLLGLAAIIVGVVILELGVSL